MPLSPWRFLLPMLVDRGHYQERVPEQPPALQPIRGLSTRARASVDTEAQAFGALLSGAVSAPLSSDELWSADGLDSQALSRMSPARLLEILADLSPEVSKGLWDFLRMSNPGFEAYAMRPSGKVKAGGAHQAALDAFLAVLKERYTSVDVIIARLFTGAWMRGGLFAELVLDQSGRVPLDIATPDPATARWKEVEDPDLGRVWQLGQWQRGQFVALDLPTVRYVPIDPLPGHPEGRAIAAPALFTATFMLAMLHDIRRVVQQQGWPRLDIEIDIEKMASAMPAGARTDPNVFKDWVEATITEVVEVYRCVQPDDAYTHASFIKVNRPVGAVDSSSLGAVDGLIQALERMLVRALKTIPLLFGVTDGVSEANANRQWEMYVAGIKAIQHLAEGLLEHLCTLALRAQGIPAVVQWRFAELRAAEMLRDAQTEQLQLANIITKYNQGWTSQDEASQDAVGHTPDQETPRAGTTSGPGVATNPDPGSNK
jgi:hypothetical protein